MVNNMCFEMEHIGGVGEMACFRDNEKIVKDEDCKKCEDYKCPYCLNQSLISKNIMNNLNRQKKKQKLYRILSVICFSIIIFILQTLFSMLATDYQFTSIDFFLSFCVSGIFTTILPMSLLLFLYYILKDNQRRDNNDNRTE